MISEERLDWLLGHSRPARVIPAGLVREPVGKVADEDRSRVTAPLVFSTNSFEGKSDEE
ncbi:MAG: hypothetical protein QNL91_14825 [Candidatus Krumholzibacteria bacterium]|nr:hypothetical protein [Candidatus Krumholzibacteria bacterium]